MTTYTAHFHGDAQYASHDFEADTPEQALALARQLYDDHPSQLCFQSYDDGMPINEITICTDDEDELAVWRDADLTLHLAAWDLLEAAEKVVARWQQGDLAEAVRELSNAIAKAKGGAA
jgi:hypothetical protein